MILGIALPEVEVSMRALLIPGLAVLLLATAAEARPGSRHKEIHQPASPHPVMAPLEQAATDCFAETVMSNPKATGLARQGQWYEAAGVIGFLCRPEVGRMVEAHDRLYGRGTGDRFFKGAYARHLDKQLAARLQPMLEPPKAVVSADASVEPSVLTGKAVDDDPVKATAAH